MLVDSNLRECGETGVNGDSLTLYKKQQRPLVQLAANSPLHLGSLSDVNDGDVGPW